MQQRGSGQIKIRIKIPKIQRQVRIGKMTIYTIILTIEAILIFIFCRVKCNIFFHNTRQIIIMFFIDSIFAFFGKTKQAPSPTKKEKNRIIFILGDDILIPI